MKKILILLFVLMLGGCGSGSDYSVSFVGDDSFQAGREIPIELMVAKGNEGVAGLVVGATFEMKSMDHDTLEVSFTDAGNGKYTANTLFPMSGEWEAYVKLSDGNQEEEVLLSITVKE